MSAKCTSTFVRLCRPANDCARVTLSPDGTTSRMLMYTWRSFLRKRMNERQVYINIREVVPSGDKVTRAQSFAGRHNLTNVDVHLALIHALAQERADRH